MPFISKDWRSPGEEWVRYEGGWELKKTISVKSKKSNEDLQGFEDQPSDIQVNLIHFPIISLSFVLKTNVLRNLLFEMNSVIC